MAEFIGQLVRDFWGTMAEMSPYLLLGFLVAGILSVFISADMVRKHLGGGKGAGLAAVVKASLFGVPLPLCSCGVIPVAISLKKHGASRGASISFLLSTPQTGVDSLFVTYSLLGPVFAIFRPIIAFITGLIGGGVVNLFGERDAKSDSAEDDEKEECQDDCCKHKNQSKLKRIFKHGFITLPRDIAGPMLAGVLVAAVLGAVIPDYFFAEKIGSGFASMVIMLFLGIPVYVCATASVPVAAVLIAKGLTPGAAIVFLMTGPATNAAALATIWKIMGSKTAMIYLITVIVCALGSGLLLDAMFPNLTLDLMEHVHKMGNNLIGQISAVILLAVLISGLVGKLKKKKEE